MNVTFALARKLQRSGHRIHYLTIPDTEDRIRAQGFDWSPIFTAVFPKGELDKQSAAEVQGKAYGAAEFKARLCGMCEVLRNGELPRVSAHIHPDLLMVSSGMPWLGIAAGTCGIPMMQFSSTLISVEDSFVPPFRTDIIPTGSLLSRLHTILAWKKLLLRRKYRNREWDISVDLRELARACSFPLKKISFSVETWPRLSLPELVFCPKEFDFPRPNVPEGVLFVEASIDLERKDVAFPWSQLESNKPLVLCALGSLLTIKAAPIAARFFQMFLDAIRGRPSVQAVVAIGSHLKPEQFNCPPNALLLSHVPQVELLKRCAAMVGHGGFSSVKECIFMGVPMLLVPMSYDEPGNAARAVYHRVGLRLRFEEVSPTALGSKLDLLLKDETFRARARHMAETFKAKEDHSPACEAIEGVLAQADAAARVPEGNA